MHLLVLGYSSIVRRRVLPAARTVGAFSRISIASRSHGAPPGDGNLTWFADYEQALASSRADLVYISGTNDVHGVWIERALSYGCHVAVDKPALVEPDSTAALVAMARRLGRGLAEATVFAFHPAVHQLVSLLPPAQAGATRVTAAFSFPPLPAGDFRYRAECGGGSIADLGSYVAALDRLVFGDPPASVTCRILSRTGSPSVDTSFSVLLTHEQGGALAGHFGFVTAYENRVSALTPSGSVELARVFTTPPDFTSSLRVTDGAGERYVTVPPADAFARFLQAFADAIEHNAFEAFEAAMLADAALRGRLHRAAASRSPSE